MKDYGHEADGPAAHRSAARPHFSGTKMRWMLDNDEVGTRRRSAARFRHGRELAGLQAFGRRAPCQRCSNASRTPCWRWMVRSSMATCANCSACRRRRCPGGRYAPALARCRENGSAADYQSAGWRAISRRQRSGRRASPSAKPRRPTARALRTHQSRGRPFRLGQSPAGYRAHAGAVSDLCDRGVVFVAGACPSICAPAWVIASAAKPRTRRVDRDSGEVVIVPALAGLARRTGSPMRAGDYRGSASPAAGRSCARALRGDGAPDA